MFSVSGLPRAAGIAFAPFLIVFAVLGAQVTAVEISTQHHSWGRFMPGAWQITSTTTETLDENGNVVGVSTTEQYMKLVAVSQNKVVLRRESRFEVGGKKFTAPVQTIAQGLHGEDLGQQSRVEDLGSNKTSIAGKPIDCRVGRYVIADNDVNKSVKVYYSPDVAPYVLRRETVATGRRRQVTRWRTYVQVVAFDKPHEVLSDTLPTNHLRTVHSDAKGSTVTYAVHAASVPGEVVSSTSKEIDSQGRLVRRSTMKLIDYGFENEVVGPPTNWSRRTYRKMRRRGR